MKMPKKLLPEVTDILNAQMIENAHLPLRWSLPPSQARAQTLAVSQRWNRNLTDMAEVKELSVKSRDGESIRARLMVPHDANAGLILFIHGGGWTVGDIDTHEGTARRLAYHSGNAVLSCNYRLAPEHPFPAGLHDCLDVWHAIMADKIPQVSEFGGPRAVAGDSSGANLAISLMMSQIQDDLPVADFGILFYGVYGADFDSPSYQDFQNGPVLTRSEMQMFWDMYAPELKDRENPLAVPLTAPDDVLKALPPLFLGVAKVDPLYSENVRLKDRLASLGRQDVWMEYVGVPHGFIQMNLELPIADIALLNASQAFNRYSQKRARAAAPEVAT